MRRAMTALALVAACLLAGSANAGCFGSSSFQTCTDSSGNSYTVNRFGNTTTVYGSNGLTGSQWNETVTKFGNSTLYNGTTNGQPWNMQQHNFGGMSTFSGMNSAGQPFSYTCTQYGGCQ